jgi:ankyrin repeat protein
MTCQLGVLNNDLRVVDNLYIKNHEQIHQVDKNGWSPLHEAARAGHIEMVKYLYERDVDILISKPVTEAVRIGPGFGTGTSWRGL